MRVGICTDSSSQLPAELAALHEVEVVPMTITVGDVEFLDGVDIGADQFYAMVADDQVQVSAAEPSPGQFAVAYDDLIARGCTEILSVHAASRCGNLLAARVAARSVSVPVRLVDSETEGFAVGCCAITAAKAVARGASIEEAAQLARLAATSVRSAVMDDARSLIRADGASPARITSMTDCGRLLGEAVTTDDAVALLVAFALDGHEGRTARPRVAIGIADRETGVLRDALEHALAGLADIEHFRIGPSAGSQFGPGAVICAAF
jgi:hypothetical protein